MKKQYHILNGDALKQQFPKSIQGEIIIVRECLIEGNVKGEALGQFFDNRAEFISEAYKATKQDYNEKVAAEFFKILDLENAEVNLWFEDDLFCQVNFWFVAYLLQNVNNNENQVYLIRPKSHTPYAFGGLDTAELLSVYENRMTLTALGKFSELWLAYQADDVLKMTEIASELEVNYPFVMPVVQAHIQRLPSEDSLGRPIDTLIAIMDELKTDEFELVFREFNKRESIYGFGDLQVKRFYGQIKAT